MMAQVPQLRPGFRFQWEPAQQAHVLLYPEGMVKLNGSAGAILAEVDGERCVRDIVARLEQQFPQAGSLAGDVTDFLRDAERQHWIRLS
ncbi:MULTISPECIES: pyrroloquinoline quinone biosynthesis peptide chaperone PqqD [Marinobacter]|uniref:PqqA binding protein n=1 Tax=Marinobacter xestospongiae TaxID=994319 RepID=A0ABU3W2U2_9GAMM|nr:MULTISPECIES: pyrroloquinoline quinone biosynthesis peptide chaperone PqqD [Marinobacter]MCG8516894.1 pyrroloquinoline quinone biosynthesis peptide chaperone PqqD [Pseudomonadales bacterium]MCK7569124.1 pyrroloquinoline quinone biosynthesis peptide chaperone PqqD [Marinobacter xestospongiae]MDV2080286.1 pyrroloquinoline quinone biosynthesis peptide chaperone PqqD [Marinobacter xestospongiae]UDL04487.1 pyrroloquinoline quinone biosynthesis peptide chaperone PqqD [Marinobacter sp. CA1]